MSLKKDVSSVLQQYAGETGVYSTQKVQSDFAEVTQQMSAEHVTNGLSEAFRSEQTPPFDQLLGESFEQGDGRQRAGMLNLLLDVAGSSARRPLVESGVLQQGADGDGAADAVTPELAERMHPGLVQQAAYEAQQEDPELIEKMSYRYVGDAVLLRTLAVGALGVALSKIAENH